MKDQNNNFYFIILSVSISFLFSTIYHYIPKSIDAGLVIGNFINYPEHPSLMREYFSTSFTLLNFFSAGLLKISNSIFFSSKIIIFLNTLLLALGFLYLIFGLTKSKFFSSIATIAILFLEIKSGSSDYPTLYFSEHIYGSFSFSIFTFFLGSFILKKFTLSGYTLGLFIAIHPVTSTWLILHFIILIIFFRYKKINILNKSFFTGLSFGILSFFLFFIYYKFIIFKNTNYVWNFENQEFINNFIKYFDYHRGIADYYIKINIFIFGSNIFLLYMLTVIKNNKNLLFVIALIILLNFSGQIIFFISRFYFDLFPMILKNIMPTRFLTFCSPVLIPLLISIIFKILNERFFCKNNFFLKNRYLFPLIITVFLITPFLKSERLISITENIVGKQKSYNLKKIASEDRFWDNLRKINTSGHLITIGDESINKNYIYYISFKPLLLDTTALNFLPYLPNLAGYYKNIMKDVYGFEINKLKSKDRNRSNIPTEISIKHFKNLDKKQWHEIKNKYNVSGLVLNKSIKLKIEPYLYGKSFNFYLFK